MDVEAIFYPRTALQHVGIAPLTSMFLHGQGSQRSSNDFRPAVHDSEGLAMVNGSGERIWRPLNNPKKLQAALSWTKAQWVSGSGSATDLPAISGSRGALRTPSERLGRTERPVGQRLGRADRDPGGGRNPRQYRRLLEAAGGAAAGGHVYAYSYDFPGPRTCPWRGPARACARPGSAQPQETATAFRH